MSLATLANISGMPGMDLAVSAGKEPIFSRHRPSDLIIAYRNSGRLGTGSSEHQGLQSPSGLHTLSRLCLFLPFDPQRQALELSDRCARLLVAYREGCEGLEGSNFSAAADEITRYAFFYTSLLLC